MVLLAFLLPTVAFGEDYSGDYWFDKANESYSNKFYDSALQQIELSLELNQSNDRAWNMKGCILNELNDYDNAILCYEKAIEINSSYSMPLNNKGVALLILGRGDEAIECFNKAIQIDPSNILAWNNKGHYLLYLGKYDEAIGCYDKALEIDPSSENARKNKEIALSLFLEQVDYSRLTSFTLDRMVTLTYPEKWITDSGSDSITMSSWFYTMNPKKTAVVDVEINRGLYPLIELEFEALKLADWVPHSDDNYTDQAIPTRIDGHPACRYLREYSNGQKVTIDVITYRESDICIGLVGSAYPRDWEQVEAIMNSVRLSVPSKGLLVYCVDPPEPYYGHSETTKVKTVTPETIAENVPKWLARKYVLDYFDCSEIAAYAEHWLEAHGINTKIVASNDIHHAWLLCQLDDGNWIPVEPQMGGECVITDPHSQYRRYNLVFDGIYEARIFNPTEWDWWNS